MHVTVEKKIALVKILSLVIVLYSLPFPALSYFGIIPENFLQTLVLLLFGVAGGAGLFYLKKSPQKYKSILAVLLIASHLVATIALINVPNDNFRAIWFYFLIFIAFFVGGKKVGFIFSAATLVTLLLYFSSPLNSIDTVSFITIVISLLIMVQITFYFTSIMKANERKLFDYQHNLESMVKEKLAEIKILNNEIINTQQEVIYTMGAIGETRSKETGQHVKRVAEYSYLLAQLSGLDEEEALTLKLASPMHDIGKIGIEDAILNKPGKLSAAEFEIMKEHAHIGYEMLKHSDRAIFKTAAIVALQHHEKYNGKGYPNALKGEEIHIYGRITALADVFDALGSDRVYKKAWKDEEIFKFLKEQSGQHLDPKLVELFFDNLGQFLNTRDKFKD
ncbi:MAG: HD domain-containing protein [Psychromonas sp.]|nr:HD domain-containing protein [Psychromonas sp.]